MEKKPLEIVKFTPYRGEIEPVGKVHVADVNFYANYLEVILHYEYIQVSDDVKSENYVRFAEIFPKGSFSVSLATVSHDEDKKDERVPAVFIAMHVPHQVVIRCHKQRQAEEIYAKIKEWLLSEISNNP